MGTLKRNDLRAVSTKRYTRRLLCGGTVEAKTPREARLKIAALLGIEQMKPLPQGMVIREDK